jgi:hypothetical protein
VQLWSYRTPCPPAVQTDYTDLPAVLCQLESDFLGTRSARGHQPSEAYDSLQLHYKFVLDLKENTSPLNDKYELANPV